MPRRRQYYEPVVEQQASPMRGFQVEITGTYVLLDDIVTALREYADANDSDDVREAAEWLRSGEQPDQPEEEEDVVASVDDQVDRIEVFPDDIESPKPKWFARACSNEGDILFTTAGSYDQEYVIKDAGERWPDRKVHLVESFMVDTVWEERAPDAVRSPHTKRRRPSPKRLWPGQ